MGPSFIDNRSMYIVFLNFTIDPCCGTYLYGRIDLYTLWLFMLVFVREIILCFVL